MVADNDSIARGAPIWAKIFGAAGRTYRVRLAGIGQYAAPAITTEAQSLGAIAILWAGSPDTHSLAASTAAHLGIPLFNEETLDHVRTLYRDAGCQES